MSEKVPQNQVIIIIRFDKPLVIGLFPNDQFFKGIQDQRKSQDCEKDLGKAIKLVRFRTASAEYQVRTGRSSILVIFSMQSVGL